MPDSHAAQPQLLLRIVGGPHKGTRAPVREGLTMGRKDGDLILNDSKMSIKHARIEWRDGEWVLVDLGSSNKIKVEGERFAEVVIYPGLLFTVGATEFEVLEKPKAERVKERDGDFEFTGSVEVPVEALTWREILSALLSNAQALPTTKRKSTLRPFPSTLRLEFVSGVQHGTTWTLGYGPREAGAKSFDLPLFDDAAADSCFHLDTAKGKLLFRSSSGHSIVRLNGKVASTEPVELRTGDRIEFGKTRIRVSVD
jgi:pSer/pThr/pTyr-binding forkhead associated (FHA) protein